MTAPRSEETVRRYSWHVARQIENATKCFVDAADFDVLTAAFNDVTAERDRLREALEEIVSRPKVSADHFKLAIQSEWVTNVATAALASGGTR